MHQPSLPKMLINRLEKVALAAFAMVSIASSPGSSPSLIASKTLDGKPFALSEQRGHVVIVTFWATWCAPCKAEMPALDAYYRRHQADGLSMLAISVDAGASIKKLQGATSAYSFPVARLDDTRMARSAIPTALPETRVFDRLGALRYDSASEKGRPPIDGPTLERVVTPLLASDVTTR